MLADVALDDGGLHLDRSWAIVDLETGLVASVKRPARWASLLLVTSWVSGDHVCLALPDGTTCSTGDVRSLNERLSVLVERKVALRPAASVDEPTLERTDPDVDVLLHDGRLEVGEIATGPLGTASPPGTVFDFAPIHVISTPTLEALEAAGEPTAGDRRRFRPNLVVDLDGPPFQENDWPGRRMHLGSDVVLDIIIQSPRCVVPSLAQPDLPRSASPLRAVAALNRIALPEHGTFSCVGAYATASQGGSLSVGSDVSIDPATG